LVRWAFHDSGTFNPADGTGGSHACSLRRCAAGQDCEFTNPANAGLQPIINQMLNLYNSNGLSAFIGLADFMYAAVNQALRHVSNGQVDVTLRWGRHDCPSSPLPFFPERLPSPDSSFQEMVNIFETRLGFPRISWFALIGAHSLGRGMRRNTGQAREWTTTPAKLDNSYFKILVDTNILWIREPGVAASNNDNIPSNPQWQRSTQPPHTGTMMLSSDINLGWCVNDATNCGAFSQTCSVTHVSGSCDQRPDELAICQHFADNLDDFFDTFTHSMQMLQEMVTEPLNDITN
jgi:catalase (peroxidase I)